MPAWGKGKAPGLGRSNDGKQQVFLDPYRIYIDYADSDLSYDEMTEDGIKRREKGAKKACRGHVSFLFQMVRFPRRQMMSAEWKMLF